MKLVENPKAVAKSYSAIALAVLMAIPALWTALPLELKALIPADKMTIVTAVVAFAGFVGRFVQQNLLPPAEPKPDDQQS